MRILIKVFLKIRLWLEPISFWLFKEHVEIPDKWAVVKNLAPLDFQDVLLAFSYKPDRLKGLLDNTLQNPDYFFADLKHNRDCDDFARMWSWYLLEQGWNPIEIVTWKNGIRKAHMFTVVKAYDGFALFDYSEQHIKQGRGLEWVVTNYLQSDKWVVYRRW